MPKYRGWIPTVAGKLSFRVIGDTKHPTPCIYSNSLVGKHRYVLCYQRRNLSDAPLSGIAALRSLTGDFWFVLVSRVRQDLRAINSSMYGHVFLIKDHDQWRNQIEPGVKDSQGFIARYQNNLLEQPYIEDRVVSSIKNIVGRLNTLSDLSAHVVLSRTGEVSLSRVAARASEWLDVSEDLRVYANVALSDIIAAQFYYFIRDISHTHQHHNRNTDTILSVHPSTDDVDWRKMVLFSLYNHIISRKRAQDIIESYNSLGILAYAKSFYSISEEALQRKKLWEEHRENFPTFLNDQLRESIEATINRLETLAQARSERRQNRWNRKFFWIGTVITILGLLYAFGGDQPIENARMACMVRVARENIFSLIPLILAVYVAYSIGSAAIEIRQWVLVRGLARILFVLPRSVAITGLLIFGLGVVPLGWYYFNSAFIDDNILIEIWNSVAGLLRNMYACPVR